jgi:hypothetical protein
MNPDRSEMSSRDYEREAEASRHRLASDLRQLSDRLTPGQIVDEMLTYAKGGGGTFLNALTNAAKHNPVPSLLIGAGLMMFLSEKTGLTHVTGGHSDTHPSHADGNGYRDHRADTDRYTDRGYADTARAGNGHGHGIRDAIGGAAAAGANAFGGIADAGRNAVGGVMGAGAGMAGAAASGVKNAADTAVHGARRGAQQVGAAVAGAADAARQAAAGIGAGVAGVGGAIGSGIAEAGASVAGTADDLMHRAQDFGGAVGERAAMMGGRVYGGAREAPRKVGDGVMQAKDNLMGLVGDQPLVAGALGLAVGALVAAVLPKTEAEDQLMGEAADSVKTAVSAVAAEEMEAAKNVATTVASTVANTVASEVGKVAEEHGLSAEGAAAAVHTATDKLKEAVGLPSEDEQSARSRT